MIIHGLESWWCWVSRNITEAIEYLKNFKEGDNITITCDFVSAVELLEEFIELEMNSVGIEDVTGMSFEEMMGDDI